jgi:hypothetical protein
MKKSLLSRIAGLAALYCLVFFLLAMLQFSGKGNFSLSAGAMTIRGRYLQTEPAQADEISGEKRVTGGIKIFFGGLEFNLKEEREKGLFVSDNNGFLTPVNPESITIKDSAVRFGLPGGNALVFNSLDSARGPELYITAELAENITEVTIPIIIRRSSLVRDNGQSAILYGGFQYSFSNPSLELENGRLVLSRERTSVSYRSKSGQKVFDPEDYIIAQAQNYDSVVDAWRDSSYAYWNQNAASLQYEDDVIAYCTEALRRGNYTAAVGAISRNFLNSARQSYRSSVFIGGMSGAFRSFTDLENENLNHITGLTRERSLDIFKEEHILAFLFSRNNTALAAEVINIMQNAEAEMLISDYCAGLFEAYSDFRRYRSTANNPLEHLTEQALLIVSENLSLDSDNDLLFVSGSESGNPEYSMRLGRALVGWAQADSQWAAIGRSLVLSALSSSGYGSGKLYNMLNYADYYPRAQSLSDSLWAWTASPSVTASTVNGNLNISFLFPVSSSHYVIIKGVRPFNRIQIHDMDWRTDSQFERYDSSGWIYYSQEQTLILKMRHRAQVETIRIFYRAETPPAPPPAVEERNTEINTPGDIVDLYYYY